MSNAILWKFGAVQLPAFVQRRAHSGPYIGGIVTWVTTRALRGGSDFGLELTVSRPAEAVRPRVGVDTVLRRFCEAGKPSIQHHRIPIDHNRVCHVRHLL